jgi:hypothetical protein
LPLLLNLSSKTVKELFKLSLNLGESLIIALTLKEKEAGSLLSLQPLNLP